MEDYVANNARAYRPRYFTGDDSYEKTTSNSIKRNLTMTLSLMMTATMLASCGSGYDGSESRKSGSYNNERTTAETTDTAMLQPEILTARRIQEGVTIPRNITI